MWTDGVMAEHKQNRDTAPRPTTIGNHHLKITKQFWFSFIKLMKTCESFCVSLELKSTHPLQRMLMFESLMHLWSHLWCIFRLIKSPNAPLSYWFKWRHSDKNDLKWLCRTENILAKNEETFMPTVHLPTSHNFKIRKNAKAGLKSLVWWWSWCTPLGVRWPYNLIRRDLFRVLSLHLPCLILT